MRINYNVTGADRKALVRAMVELLGEPPVYQGAPSFAYAVGGYRVDKDGIVSVPEDTAPEDIRKLVDALREKGFQPVEPAEQPTAAADTGESDPAQADDEDLRFLIIKVPRDGFTPETEENLRRIIASKAPPAISDPSVTRTPSFIILRTGAVPLIKLMLESGQCATHTPLSFMALRSRSSEWTQCAITVLSLNRPNFL